MDQLATPHSIQYDLSEPLSKDARFDFQPVSVPPFVQIEFHDSAAAQLIESSLIIAGTAITFSALPSGARTDTLLKLIGSKITHEPEAIISPSAIKQLLESAIDEGCPIKSSMGSDSASILKEYCMRVLLDLADRRAVDGLRVLVFKKLKGSENSFNGLVAQSGHALENHGPESLVWIDGDHQKLKQTSENELVLNLLSIAAAGNSSKGLPISMITGEMRSGEAEDLAQGLHNSHFRIPVLEKVRSQDTATLSDTKLMHLEVRHIRAVTRSGLLLTLHEGPRQAVDFYWGVVSRGEPVAVTNEAEIVFSLAKKGIERVSFTAIELGREFLRVANHFSEQRSDSQEGIKEKKRTIAHLHELRSELLQYLSEFRSETSDLCADQNLGTEVMRARFQATLDSHAKSTEKVLDAHLDHAKRADKSIEEDEKRFKEEFARVEGKQRRNFQETMTVLAGVYVFGNVLVRADHPLIALGVALTGLAFQATRYWMHQQTLRREEAKYWSSNVNAPS